MFFSPFPLSICPQPHSTTTTTTTIHKWVIKPAPTSLVDFLGFSEMVLGFFFFYLQHTFYNNLIFQLMVFANNHHASVSREFSRVKHTHTHAHTFVPFTELRFTGTRAQRMTPITARVARVFRVRFSREHTQLQPPQNGGFCEPILISHSVIKAIANGSIRAGVRCVVQNSSTSTRWHKT